jgi:lactate dehydrogenase-like 2-hydroxyacid dehydrogenase
MGGEGELIYVAGDGAFDKELVEGLPRSLRWICHNGAGYVDVDACTKRGKWYSSHIRERASTD